MAGSQVNYTPGDPVYLIKTTSRFSTEWRTALSESGLQKSLASIRNHVQVEVYVVQDNAPRKLEYKWNNESQKRELVDE